MDLREEIKKEIEKVVVEMGISADKLSVSFPIFLKFATSKPTLPW